MAELKIDDLKPVKSEEVKEPTAHEKAAEKLKESVRELHAGGSKSELEKTADKITGAFKKASEKAKDTADGVITEETRARFDLLAAAAAELQDLGNSIFYGEAPTPEQAKQHDINVLRAELQDKVAELRDLKKNISKMQQTHEAELQDLKDQLGEAQAEAAAAKKAHAHAVGEKNNYADTLDNDSIAFEEIRALAVIMDRNAKSLQELAKMVQERTEV